MGRKYSIVMESQSISAAQDLIRVTADTDKSIKLLQARATQSNIDTQEQLAFQIHRASTDGAGDATTPQPLSAGDAAFGGTAITDLSSDTTVTDVLFHESESLLNGFRYLPTPEEQIEAPGGGRLVLRLDSAPDAATTISAVMIIEEIG